MGLFTSTELSDYMLDPRGLPNLIPMLRLSIVVIIGIIVSRLLIGYITPMEWCGAAVVMCILAAFAERLPRIGSVMVWIAVFYVGAFLYSARIANNPELLNAQSYKYKYQHEDEDANPVVNKLREWRATVVNELRDSGATDDALAVTSAMTMGDKSMLSRETKTLFSIAGVSHILALSGMHIGIIVLILNTILGRRRRRRKQNLSSILILLAVWFYLLFVGMPLSAVRAAIMLTTWTLVNLFRRNQHPLNVLGTAALITILISPTAVFDVGFQLSYIAVLFIFICVPYFESCNPWKIVKSYSKPYSDSWRGKEIERKRLVYRLRKLWQWFWSLMSVSVAAQLGTAPLVAYYFGRFSCFFLITNIIVIPLAFLLIIMMLIAIVGILSGCSMLLGAGVWLINTLACALNTSVGWVSGLPGASIEGIELNVIQLILIYFAIGGMMYIVSLLRFKLPEPES